MNIRYNSILMNKSLVDGPGIRTVLFLQGCDIHCKGCHNASSWDPNGGKLISIDELVSHIKSHTINKKITISGGEPLLQKEALIELVKALDGFDITLYTGHKRSEVPEEIIPYLTYLKTGPFVDELKSTTTPYVGSKNQKFEKVGK